MWVQEPFGAVAMGLAETQDQESNPTTDFQYKLEETQSNANTVHVYIHTTQTQLSKEAKHSATKGET